MKVHKWFYRLLSVTLLALAGLGAVANAQSRTVEVAVRQGIVYDWYEVVAEKFMRANPDIKIELIVVPGGVNEQRDWINTRLAAGNPPDIADQVPRFWQEWADLGVLVDMLPLFEKSTVLDRRDFFPGLIDKMLYRGGLYHASTTVDPFLTVFVQEAFEEAGIADPYMMSESGEWSWRAGEEAARRLVRMDASGNITQWGWSPATNTDWTWASYITANGGSLVSDDYTQVRFAEEPAVEAMRWIASLYNDLRLGERRSLHQINPTRVAMATGNADHLRNRLMADELARPMAAPIAPPQAGMTSRGWMFAGGGVIFDKGENVDAAWRFIEWTMSEESQRDLVMVNGRFPTRTNVALEIWGAEVADWIGGADRAHVFFDVATNATFPPFGPFYGDLSGILTPVVSNILAGQVDARIALTQAAEQAQAILDEYQKR